MKYQNLNYENTILELSRLSRKVKKSVFHIILEKIARTGHIDERAIEILEKEKKVHEEE